MLFFFKFFIIINSHKSYKWTKYCLFYFADMLKEYIQYTYICRFNSNATYTSNAILLFDIMREKKKLCNDGL